MRKYLNWIVARLCEASTWAGIAAGCTAVSVAISNHATLAAALLAGVAAVLIPERND